MDREKGKFSGFNESKSTYIDRILSSRSDLHYEVGDRLDLDQRKENDPINGLLHAKASATFKIRNFIPISFILFFGLLLVGSLFFPNYSLFFNAISDIGNPIKNPCGWIFFGIALWLLAFMHVPIINYMHKKLVILDKSYTILGTLSLATASFGMFLIVFFPNTPSDQGIHGLLATFVFTGSVAGIMIYWFVILKDAVFNTKSKRMRSITPFLSMVAGFVVIALLMGVSQLNYFESIPFIPREGPAAPWFLGFPFWEWSFMISLTVQLTLLLKFRKSFYLANATQEGMNDALSEFISSNNKDGLDEK